MQSSGQTPLEVRLSELPRSADGRLDASPLLRYISEKDSAALRAPPRGVGTRVLFIRLEHGEELPPLGQALAWVHFRTKKHFIGDCQVHTALYSNMIDKPDDASGVQESISRLNHDIQAVGEEMTPRPKRPRMGKLVGSLADQTRAALKLPSTAMHWVGLDALRIKRNERVMRAHEIAWRNVSAADVTREMKRWAARTVGLLT